MFKKGIVVATLLSLTTGCFTQPGWCQQSGQTTGQADVAGSEPKDLMYLRVHRQHARISHALKTGLITDDQAKQLRSAVDDIAAQIAQMRQANGGTLKPEDFKQMESALNHTSAQIQTVAESGDKTVSSGDALGAAWTKGPDGAQNPGQLLKEMKQENKRELRQEKQNTEQKVEQQQLEYEREMVEKMGEQRQNILKQKDDLKDIRQESGAD